MSPECELPLCHYNLDLLVSELSTMMSENEVHRAKWLTDTKTILLTCLGL